MPTIQVEANLSPKTLIEAASQLSQIELDMLVEQLVQLRAQRKTPRLSERETELLHKINVGLPEKMEKRLDYLQAQQDKESLTKVEHQEMLQLLETIEHLTAQRIHNLSELASLRKMTVRQLMQDLGINVD